MRIAPCVLLAIVFLPPLHLAAGTVSPAETKTWLRHAIPLPQDIRFERSPVS